MFRLFLDRRWNISKNKEGFLLKIGSFFAFESDCMTENRMVRSDTIVAQDCLKKTLAI